MIPSSRGLENEVYCAVEDQRYFSSGLFSKMEKVDENLVVWRQSRGHAGLYWFRHYATSRRIAGSRPDEVIYFFFQYT
jgi:hypothetical protein